MKGSVAGSGNEEQDVPQSVDNEDTQSKPKSNKKRPQKKAQPGNSDTVPGEKIIKRQKVGDDDERVEEESKVNNVFEEKEKVSTFVRQEKRIKGPVRKWEKRWVLQPNVIEYGCDIWI